jgi:hypothetical protein
MIAWEDRVGLAWKISRSSPPVMSWYSTQTICLFAKMRRYLSGRIFLGRLGLPEDWTSLYQSRSPVKLVVHIISCNSSERNCLTGLYLCEDKERGISGVVDLQKDSQTGYL